jgi:hypothetical protein
LENAEEIPEVIGKIEDRYSHYEDEPILFSDSPLGRHEGERPKAEFQRP